jgi:3-oxoacyl-[acyl-carrier protein] reductase
MERKSIWITGAGSGIGKALAQHFLTEGFLVIATDIDKSTLSDLSHKGNHALSYAQDVRDYATWESLIQSFSKNRQMPYYLVNNAGVCLPEAIEKSGRALIDHTMDVNTKGLMYGTSLFAAACLQRGQGHIINICSLAGITPTPGLGAYSASKFAARGYTLTAAMELRDKGIHVTAICPDGVHTPMIEKMAESEASAMAFSGPGLLQAKDVVKAVQKAMITKKPEITLPAGRAFIAKMAGLYLPLVWGLKDTLIRKGTKKRMLFKGNN